MKAQASNDDKTNKSVDNANLHRLLYPQVPAILSASHDGRTSAMLVVSYMVLSEAPPLVGVSCSPHAFTFKLAVRAKAFSLAFVDERHVPKMEALTRLHGSATMDKLSSAGLDHTPGPGTGAPIISDALANIELKLQGVRKTGDHRLLTGEVIRTTSRHFKGGWDFRAYHPVLYTGWAEGMTTLRNRRRPG